MPRSVMASVRNLERKGLVFVRGYRLHDYETPFEQGYLVTAIEREKDKETLLKEAILRTQIKLENTDSRVFKPLRLVRDKIIVNSRQQNKLTGFDYFWRLTKVERARYEYLCERLVVLYLDIRRGSFSDTPIFIIVL